MITNTYNHEEAAIVVELERLSLEQQRLERLYPYLESRRELRRPFMTELAAMRVRAERLDALLQS